MLGLVGVEVYLPRAPARDDGATPSDVAPLFPGYLFGRLSPQRNEFRLANSTPGVLYVVGYGDQPWPVPDGFISYIRRRLNRERRSTPAEDLRHGDRLVITGGPFRGIEAVFDRHLSGSGRARVLVEMLKRVCPAEVHVREVRPIRKTVGTVAR
jgi:transcriptional antiterminator RfaH